MFEIDFFESPIMDEGKQSGTLVIIRGVFPDNADEDGVLKCFEAKVKEIANNKFKDGYLIFYPDYPDYPIAVILQGSSNISFKRYQCI